GATTGHTSQGRGSNCYPWRPLHPHPWKGSTFFRRGSLHRAVFVFCISHLMWTSFMECSSYDACPLYTLPRQFLFLLYFQ
ncbi:hypothetical protein NDU88_003151, partial [Pleurodeles waltl]